MLGLEPGGQPLVDRESQGVQRQRQGSAGSPVGGAVPNPAPDLDGSEAAASGQHERRRHGAAILATAAFSRSRSVSPTAACAGGVFLIFARFVTPS